MINKSYIKIKEDRRDIPLLTISESEESSHESDQDILDEMNIANVEETESVRSVSIGISSHTPITTWVHNKYAAESSVNSYESVHHEGVRNEISKRKTSNKERLKVMMKKRKERERKIQKQQNMSKKRRKRNIKQKVYTKSNRIDLDNETKLKIVNHYLKNKRKDRNYNAKSCKLYFESKDINCGRSTNINAWSRNINTIKSNMQQYGKHKMRNRARKSWFYVMEQKLVQIINRRNRNVSDEWIRNKALQLCQKMYPDRDFTASRGWLTNFKQRHSMD